MFYFAVHFVSLKQSESSEQMYNCNNQYDDLIQHRDQLTREHERWHVAKNQENSMDFLFLFLQRAWNAKREITWCKASKYFTSRWATLEYKCFLTNDIGNVTSFDLNNFQERFSLSIRNNDSRANLNGRWLIKKDPKLSNDTPRGD